MSWLCKNCETQNDDDTQVCEVCGTKKIIERTKSTPFTLPISSLIADKFMRNIMQPEKICIPKIPIDTNIEIQGFIKYGKSISFSYKFWYVSFYMGHFQWHFKCEIDEWSIFNALLDRNKHIREPVIEYDRIFGKINKPKPRQEILLDIILKTKNVKFDRRCNFHFFNNPEDLQADAKRFIDNTLGDAWNYAIEHNLINIDEVKNV